MMIRIFYIFEIKYEKYGKKYNRAFNPYVREINDDSLWGDMIDFLAKRM